MCPADHKPAAPGRKCEKIATRPLKTSSPEKTSQGFSLLSLEERTLLFKVLAQKFPNPKSELNFNSPFQLLCAVMLSAQATDASVNLATPALFKRAPDAKSMAVLGEEGIAPYIKSIGLWRSKARNLAQTAALLQKDFGGQVPRSYAELVSLPGVGSKTALVVLNVAFHEPAVAVDTHIFRVCNRTGLCPGKNASEVQEKLAGLIPSDYRLNAHHYLLLHGRYTCKARKPLCESCELVSLCKKRGL